MASLSRHLREAGDHGRLGFHPACPVCCDERLAGTLPVDTIVSRRSPGASGSTRCRNATVARSSCATSTASAIRSSSRPWVVRWVR